MIETLVDRVGVGQYAGDERVAGLVVRDDRRSFSLITRFFSRPAMHALDGLVEVRPVDRGLVAAGREQRRLVHQVGEIGADEAGRARGDRP